MMPNKIETRHAIECRVTRNSETNEVRLTGMAVPYNTETDIAGVFKERFAKKAFDKRIDKGAVMLANHDGLPFASVRGNTMSFEERKDGLYFDASLDMRDRDAESMAVKIERGDLRGVSVGFRAEKQNWNEDYTEREILEARLMEISITPFPAYPTTDVAIATRDRYGAAAEVVNIKAKDFKTLRFG